VGWQSRSEIILEMKKLKFFFVFFILSKNVSANFLFSPSYSNLNARFNRDTTEAGDLNGQSFGAHLLYHKNIWNIGMTGNYYRYDFPQTFLNANQTQYKGWDFGPMVGLSFNRFRFWYSYLITSMEMESSVKGYYFGKGHRVGVGVRVVKNVFITLEGYKNTLDEKEIDNNATQALNPAIAMQGTLVGVTFPFIF
jgi:hypothetical protein